MAKTLRWAGARGLARLSWTLRARGNPLRRPADRKEGRVIAGLLVLFLVAGPLAAVASASLAYGGSLREMRAERWSWREITATVLGDPSYSPAGSGSWGPTARVRWLTPDGQQRVGTVSLDTSAKAGQHVTIWVDGAGQQTLSPTSRTVAVLNAITLGLTAVAFLALALATAGWIVRIVMNRRRLADWDREWRTVEPRWRSPR